MFAGLLVLLTVFSALGFGIFCGWAALSALIFIFSRSRRQLRPQTASTQVQAQAAQ